MEEIRQLYSVYLFHKLIWRHTAPCLGDKTKYRTDVQTINNRCLFHFINRNSCQVNSLSIYQKIVHSYYYYYSNDVYMALFLSKINNLKWSNKRVVSVAQTKLKDMVIFIFYSRLVRFLFHIPASRPFHTVLCPFVPNSFLWCFRSTKFKVSIFYLSTSNSLMCG